MLRKIFQPKICVALIIALLMVSVCVASTVAVPVFGGLNSSTFVILSPILLGVIYAVLISIETEPEKPSDKRKNAFAIAYACTFAAFYIFDIALIVYTFVKYPF